MNYHYRYDPPARQRHSLGGTSQKGLSVPRPPGRGNPFARSRILSHLIPPGLPFPVARVGQPNPASEIRARYRVRFLADPQRARHVDGAP